MKIAALALFVGLIGAATSDGEGFILGALLGALMGVVLGERTRSKELAAEQHRLRAELESLRRRFDHEREAVRAEAAPSPSPIAQPAARTVEPAAPAAPTAEPAAPLPWAAPPAAAPMHAVIDIAPQDVPGSALLPDAPAPFAETGMQAQHAADSAHAQRREAPQAAAPDVVDVAIERLRELVFGGNTIVRAGILVLLVGVVLLLRWAAEHAVFPLEARMGAAGLIAIVLVAVGYRQRETRPGFGRTLQGGGVAALYMVVFFSFRTYQLVPAGLAFGLLVCIALSSGVLAVAQDAKALVVIGQIGGFMAPVLASSGGGSHVALFSYYLLLNLLIFAVAWFKPWRALNLIGFCFTFGIGSTWGALSYRPEDFASTEPFLAAFFLLYSLIPVLYALRRPDEKRGWVDASLVFGTPLAVLMLQYAMVKDVPFGMAYSALGLAAFYVALSRALYTRAPEALRSLIEACLAIGVGFATLAVPYGFDNHDFTGATWGLEGAGLYWVGTRQKRWLSRLSGAALQLLAGGALLVQLADGTGATTGLPLANARFLASLFLCLSCLFVAHRAYSQRDWVSAFEWRALQVLIAVGLSFFLGAAFAEVDQHVAQALQPGIALSVLAVLGLSLEKLGRRLAWLPGRYPSALLVLLLPLFVLGWESALSVHPLGRAGALAFPLCLLLSLSILRHFVPAVPFSAAALHSVFVWFGTGVLVFEALHLIRDFAVLNIDWAAAGVGLVLALCLVAVVASVQRGLWPFGAAPATYVFVASSLLSIGLFMWTLWSNTNLTGDASPLPSLPLLNPLDLTQLFVFAAAGFWLGALRQHGADESVLYVVPSVLGALAFYWFNCLLARAVHQLAGVPFDVDALWNSVAMQVSLSVSWSLLGLLGTVLGSLRKLRFLWLLGAALLAVVVAKLFLVDLAQLSTIAKIVTFLVVGMLLVLVGYFAPVPPSAESQVGNAGKVRS